ncbi:hypothetical protein RhiirA4_551235 [Rhizophagus irregularis]|uniref:Integrase zinc-binding domain-containing protein n=1 Tax=Rhizophagus irregularis TaxID=588596 RepID=A0A2I1HUD7_9GLOM|nr:hypothetical protein RhiirA4_551235 [Rhizophagus irregularis]
MYKTICLEHVQNVHCGQKNLYKKLRSKWYGVKKKIIEEFVNHCEICVPRRTMSKSTLAARPIVAKRFLSRVQLNKDSDIFNEDSDDSNEDSDDLNEDSNNLNEDSDDFDENSEDFSDLNSNFNKNKNIKKQPKPKRVSNVDSSTLFQLKPPQINNITWEEINASWEGMFGYSNKLRLGVMKRDILACLRDLKVMRETNSFDNILLNIWEKKFNKWLDELDNVQNSETNEASTSSTSHKETISSHDYIRDDAKMNNKKYRDDMKILMEKKVKKKDIFKVGDIVNLKIPKADKGKLGRSHLPCKILKVKPKGFYNLGCFAGTLNVNYKGNCLESTELTSMAELTNIPNKYYEMCM